jgi:ATP-dependent DNA helicase RecG
MSKIKPKECQNVEFKSSWQDEYLKWICGFANAQGAVMYFGVNDDHEVVGLKNTKKLLEDIPNKIVNFMGLVVDVNLYVEDGLEYIEAVIEPSNVPISYKGKYYYRSGSTMQELNGVALQQFILKKMGRTWDDIPNDYATVKDLDRQAIKFFLDNGIEAGRIDKSEARASTQRVIENLGLFTEDGKLKNAALLLFAKYPHKFFTCVEFKIGRFRHDESDLIIQDVIEGNIIQMTDRVVKVLKAKYLTSPIHYENMKRKEPLEVPEDALREILYNSIAHKDYSGAPIQMRVWDDYVEIWNEGELPIGLTPEALLKKHSSHPRNKNIANAFFKAGFIESWGRGYEKIRNGFESDGLPMPKIEAVEGGVRVTFKRKNVGNSAQTLPEHCPNSAQTPSEQVLQLIKEKPTITKGELAKRMGRGERSIQDYLHKLKTENRIRRIGSATFGGYWEIVNEEK